MEAACFITIYRVYKQQCSSCLLPIPFDPLAVNDCVQALVMIITVQIFKEDTIILRYVLDVFYRACTVYCCIVL